MKKRGATKTTNEKPKGFTTALQHYATTRNQELSLSRLALPVCDFSKSPIIATLLSKVECRSLCPQGGSFYTSLFETLLANNLVTVEGPESLRQKIADFAIINGAETTTQGDSLLRALQYHTDRNLTMEEYNDWWQEKRSEPPLAHIPFLIAASRMLNTQIVLWSHPCNSNRMTAAYMFTPPVFNHQFHFTVDRNINQDPGATIECIRDYSYLVEGYKGWEYQLGTPAWDIRLAGRDPPLNILASSASMDHEGPHLSEIQHDNPEHTTRDPPNNNPIVPLHIETASEPRDVDLEGTRMMRTRCRNDGCYLTMSQDQTQCHVCIQSGATATRLQQVQPPSPSHEPPRQSNRQICSTSNCNITVCHEARLLGLAKCVVCLPKLSHNLRIPQHLTLHTYGSGHTDGGCRDVPRLRLKSVGGWAYILMHSIGELWKASCSLGPQSSNNVAEFTAVLKLVTLAKQRGITLLDVHTDSMLVIQYFERTCDHQEQKLIDLYKAIQAVATGVMHLNFHHVKAHAKKGTPQYNLNNMEVDSMCTAVIKVNDMEPRLQGPSHCAPFDAPRNVLRPRMEPRIGAKYYVDPPYAPINPDEVSPRTVVDLVRDSGDVLYICPFCNPLTPAPHKDRRALLLHVNKIHRPAPPMLEEIKDLFQIAQCEACHGYYGAVGLSRHHCLGHPPAAPVHLPAQIIRQVTTHPRNNVNLTAVPQMTSPADIAADLVDHLSGITFDSIFQKKVRTVVEMHHSSVPMWAEALALIIDGIITYAFRATAAPEDQQRATAYIKLFFLLPRLLLSSSRGVAVRARLILTGRLDAFEKLYTESEPSPDINTPQRTQHQEQKSINRRVATLVKSCDLSRAINSLAVPPRVEITQEVVNKVHELHPIAQAQHRIPRSAPTKVNLDPGERIYQFQLLNRVIKDLKIHPAPDTTGLRPGHIKCIFRGRKGPLSAEVRCRTLIDSLIHNIMSDPERFGDEDLWAYFFGGKLTLLMQRKLRPIGQKNTLLKVINAIQGRLHDEELREEAGPGHLNGKKDGPLAAAVMAQMELDYAQCNPDQIRCVLVTDAQNAFQSASRNNCYRVLNNNEHLKRFLAPFFAMQHKGEQNIVWAQANSVLNASSGFTQGDINASKLFTVNTASLVSGLQEAALSAPSNEENASVVAIIDDITVMGALRAVTNAEDVREELQKASNYLVNPQKQHVYTMTEQHVETIEQSMPNHQVRYIGNDAGFKLSGIPMGGDEFIRQQMRSKLDETKRVIDDILKLDRAQDKLLLLLYCIPGRLQHFLAAVPMSISRDFAIEHDASVQKAVADVLGLGTLNERDLLQIQRKVSNHGLGLRSMEYNLEFLFFSGFARSIKTIREGFPHFMHVVEHTIEADSGYGRQLQEALDTLHSLALSMNGERLTNLLPRSLAHTLEANFEWKHTAIQLELDEIIETRHNALYDLTRVSHQQAKAAMHAIDASLFMIIPRQEALSMSNNHLIYMARQLFGKPQRSFVQKFCPNISSSNGRSCLEPLDSHDIHVSTCRVGNLRHRRHDFIQNWFQDMAAQAHIPTTPAAQLSNIEQGNEPCRADIALIGTSLRTAERDGVNAVIDFSVVHPAAISYCRDASRTPSSITTNKATQKNARYRQQYLNHDNSNFIPFIVENGGTFGRDAEEAFSRICNIIALQTGQNRSSIAHFWRSRLLVILARQSYDNALTWTRAHNQREGNHEPDSLNDGGLCYDIETLEQRRMIHSAGYSPLIGASLEFQAENPSLRDG